MKILDNFAINIANRVVAKNDEVMSLTQENDRLQRELDASLVAITDREKRIKLCESVIEQSAKEYNELEKEKESNATKLKIKTSDFNQLNNEYKRIKNNYDELSKKKLDKEYKKQITEFKNINANQQVIASAKADKTQLKDVFSHNLCEYLVNNFDNVKQAADKLGINRTTLSELKSGKTALSYDNLDILDYKMCEYFECSVYELVTVKMEGGEMKTIVLKIKGLSDEQIQAEFSGFFNKLVEKYPNQFGVGLSVMEQNTDGEKQALRIAEL